MSHHPIRVQVGPANYFAHPGAITRLTEFFTTEELEHAFWIHGKKALAAATPYLPEPFYSPHTIHANFSGHLTDEQVAQLLAEAGETRRLVIGLGGGSVLDTAKVVARRLKLPFVAIPTIAATCAAWTPLSVWYNTRGEAQHIEYFPDANYLLLLEPTLLLGAPLEYLQAGIGDTLAKWYEAFVLTEHLQPLPFTAELGVTTARWIKDLLVEKSAQALEANLQHKLSAEFEAVVGAIIAGGGMVGGLGEKFTRIAAAHSIHNGLTAIPETHAMLHGLKVAYGILVQVALLNDEEELERLLPLFRHLQLPTSLHELKVDWSDPVSRQKLVQKTLEPNESIWLMPDMSSERLTHAIDRVEQQFTRS